MMPRYNIDIPNGQLSQIGKIAQRLSAESLAPRLKSYVRTELALDRIRDIAGPHQAILRIIKRDQEVIKSALAFHNQIATSQVAELASRMKSPRLPQSAVLDSIRKSQAQIAAVREAVIGTSSLAAFSANMYQSKLQLAGIPSVDAIAASFSRLGQVADLHKYLQNSFSLKLVTKLQDESLSFEDAVELVRESVDSRAEELSPSLISFEGMIQLLAALIFFLYAHAASQETERVIIESVAQMEMNLMQKLETLYPADTAADHYVVLRAVNLRAKPSTKSTSMSILYPNQRVELIERRKKWIYVLYFDYVEGIPRTGWVFKNLDSTSVLQKA